MTSVAIQGIGGGVFEVVAFGEAFESVGSQSLTVATWAEVASPLTTTVAVSVPSLERVTRRMTSSVGVTDTTVAVPEDRVTLLPGFHMPKRARGRTLMRGRPITTEEFERMLAAVPKVRPNDAATWVHYLKGLWLSGLRLEESTVLSWDEDSPIMVDLTGRRPRLRIYAEAEKGRQDRLLPMTPDFAQFLFQTSKVDREVLVFRIVGQYAHEQMTPPRIGRVISEIGKKANVVVRKSEGKFASAHDLRRSFGTRRAPRVKPATLQLLTRHRSIETTLKYYVAQDADEIADELWKNYEECPEKSPEDQQSPPEQ